MQAENRYSSPSFLARPPRHVPILLRLRLLFGGFMNQFGWFFFGFGMIFFWVFALNTDPMAMFVFRGKLENADGKVLEAIQTNLSVGGSENSDGTPVFRYPYEFEFDGQTYLGESYTVGKKKNRDDKVKIEFPPGRPQRSRIEGMGTAAFSSIALFVVIFPFVGICFIIPGFLFGWKAARLMHVGEYTTGKLVKTERTNTEINNKAVYKLTFEFQTESGETRNAIAKTHQTENLKDDENEPLLYDPMNPEKATLMDHLQGQPRFTPEGEIKGSGAITTMLCLIVPLLSAVGHSIAFYYLFLI